LFLLGEQRKKLRELKNSVTTFVEDKMGKIPFYLNKWRKIFFLKHDSS
jgi:hypothetical protein